MITEEQRERTSKEMKILDQNYALLEEYYKLYKEGKINTPRYEELKDILEKSFPIKTIYRNKYKRCKCK